MAKVSEAQKRASAKWDRKNKSRRQYINKRSITRNFIKKEAAKEDLDEFKNLIKNREKELWFSVVHMCEMYAMKFVKR